MKTEKELHEQMWKESKSADEQPSSFIVIPTLDAIEYIDKALELGKAQALAEVMKIIEKQLDLYHKKLEDSEELPELVLSNLSGMILSLEELKAKLQEQKA